MKPKMPGRRGWSGALAAGVLVLVAPYILPMGEAHHGWWDNVPGWWAWFGAIGCFLLVVIAQWLGHVLLHKPEDWYD